MKDIIKTYVQLYSNNVELNIAVTKDLKREEGNLKNFGYIQITEGGIDEKGIFWDNLEFFFDVSFKDYKKECGEDLEKGSYNKKQTYKDIKRLLKRAHKIGIINIKE
jgi:hypothetical protein